MSLWSKCSFCWLRCARAISSFVILVCLSPSVRLAPAEGYPSRYRAVIAARYIPISARPSHVKRNGVREPFSRDKIRVGLLKACWKRPISDDQINNLVSRVESDVYSATESEIESTKVGELVMQRLAEVDQVAYVRFASVYRQFKDVRDFVDELQPLLRPKEPQ